MKKRTFIKRSLSGMGLSVIPFKNHLIKAGFSGLFSTDDKKHIREGLYYVVTPKGVRCQICPNECDIKEGETGECRNRINKGSILYTTAYGNPCAIHIDPIEKKPLFHFYPSTTAYSIATAGCNLACLNCQNWSISQTSPSKTRNFDLMPGKVVEETLKSKCTSIAYTYSEPITFYEYTYDTASLAKESNIKNVLVSAGFINEKPLRQLCKVIDAANIDLKSFDNEIYLKLNNGKLEPVLNTLKILQEEDIWLEITNLLVPGWTDNMEMIKKMCGWLAENELSEYPLHFSRFHPQYKLTQIAPTPVATLEQARKIALSEGLKYVYIGNVPGNEAQNTFCPNCNSKVIERKGYQVLPVGLKQGNCGECGEKIHGHWKFIN